MHRMLSSWSTCSVKINLCMPLHLMKFPCCHSEKLNGFQVLIFELNLLHCNCTFFSCKSFLFAVNKISCIHSSLPLSLTLPEVWNFHTGPVESAHYMFSFTFFVNFISFTEFYVCISFSVWVENTVWPAWQNPEALIFLMCFCRNTGHAGHQT